MSNKIVFVVGAGASTVYGLPTGESLKSKVADKLIEIERKRQKHFVFEEDVEFRIFAERLQSPMVASIDLLMKTYSDIPEYKPVIEKCKSFISEIILESESIVKTKTNESHWLEHVFKSIFQSIGNDPSKLSESNIKFITFNYDRLIEHKLFEALTALFPTYQREKAEVEVQNFSENSIVHVYGSINKYTVSTFGYNESSSMIREGSNNIKIIGERCDLVVREMIDKLIQDANQLHFIGFAYHQENIDQLNLNKPNKIVLASGTTVHVGQAEINSIKSRFWNEYNIPIKFGKPDYTPNEMTCTRYIKDYVEFYETGSFIIAENKQKTSRISFRRNYERFFPSSNKLAPEMKWEELTKNTVFYIRLGNGFQEWVVLDKMD
jgi:hypothetical protein